MAVNLSPVGGVAAQFFNNNGVILTGGKIFTYAAGTSTPQVTYTSANGVTAHSNPIILDASGRVPSGEIWLTDGLSYKFVIKDSTDVLIGTYDNVVGINSNFVNFTNQQEIQTATASQTVFTLTTMQYEQGTNSLSVFVDGVNQYGPGAQYAYVETSPTIITFVNGLHVGALVKFTTSQINTASATDASQVSYTPAGAGAVVTNVQAKLRESVSVKDFGAVGDGIVNDAAAIQTTLNSGAGDVYVPDGVYLIDADLILPDNVCVYFSGDAVFKASANNRTFFKSTVSAYFSQIHNAQLDGNGKTGVTGFDMTNFRLNSGLFNPYMTLMETGFIGRQGCFGLKISNPTAYGVKFPIVFVENNSVVEVDNPVFDNSVVAGGDAAGTGVTIQYGTGTNLGARVVGGYIQGYTLGIDDAGVGTVVDGTYFEACTDVDIVAGTNARNGKYVNCEHWGPIGSACYRFRDTDAMVVSFPTMGSGARTEVFDVDSTNTNCTAFVTPSNAAFNSPIGDISGILVSGYTQDFTVTDASGAGLSITQNTQAYWTVSNNTATVSFDITYPVTTNASLTSLNLPIAARTGTSTYSGCGFTNYGTPVYLSGIGSTISVFSLATSGGLTNANMSGKRIAFTFTYIVA
jgi:hypothetical protein